MRISVLARLIAEHRRNDGFPDQPRARRINRSIDALVYDRIPPDGESAGPAASPADSDFALAPGERLLWQDLVIVPLPMVPCYGLYPTFENQARGRLDPRATHDLMVPERTGPTSPGPTCRNPGAATVTRNQRHRPREADPRPHRPTHNTGLAESASDLRRAGRRITEERDPANAIAGSFGTPPRFEEFGIKSHGFRITTPGRTHHARSETFLRLSSTEPSAIMPTCLFTTVQCRVQAGCSSTAGDRFQRDV
ncbi:hypothetical protein [Amycolatopsis sp. WAC 01375]|uniref:hypothetical protein n=1 Tax=Amycolatopsis sp. WAC 01375 TaxID=2203194 RepID=UPI000F7B4538|nr:hypothetical protein [Amycolatopsis sp. WAC 01375]